MSCTISKAFFPYKHKELVAHDLDDMKACWQYFFGRLICKINHRQGIYEEEYLPNEMNECKFLEVISLLNEVSIEGVYRQYGKYEYGCRVKHHLNEQDKHIR